MRKPSSYRELRGGSTLKGWIPVRRINRGSRGTWLSGVLISSLRTSLGGFDGGGSVYRDFGRVSLDLLELKVDWSDPSLPASVD